jgi:hypothetical protein
MSRDSVDAACMLYDDLTTWNLSSMSLRDSFFTEDEVVQHEFYFEDGTNGLGFSPCSFVDWEMINKPEGGE